MKGLDRRPGRGPGDIADAEFDEIPSGLFLLKGADPFGDIGKKVGSLKFQIMLVDCNHLYVSQLFYELKESLNLGMRERSLSASEIKVSI